VPSSFPYRIDIKKKGNKITAVACHLMYTKGKLIASMKGGKIKVKKRHLSSHSEFYRQLYPVLVAEYNRLK